MRLRYQSYAEKQATRTRNQEHKERLANALLTFAEVAKTIEDAFQPESEKLYESEIMKWEKARPNLIAADGKYNALYIIVTGHDDSQELVPVKQGQPGYDKYQKERAERGARGENFGDSYEYGLYISGKWKSDIEFKSFAEARAYKVVERNKVKLRAGIAKMLLNFQSCSVIQHKIKKGMKGFEGRFLLETDKGKLAFECFSIWVWGILVESHARYLTYLKKPEALTHQERKDLGMHNDE